MRYTENSVLYSMQHSRPVQLLDVADPINSSFLLIVRDKTKEDFDVEFSFIRANLDPKTVENIVRDVAENVASKGKKLGIDDIRSLQLKYARKG